jgi:hypothetical protein
VLLEGLFLDWLWSRHLVPAVDRQTFFGVFTEVWQRLQGSRLAVYRSADERKQGLFSVLAILDADNADEFLKMVRGLARLSDPRSLKLSGPDAAADDTALVKKLIEELGDSKFRTRNSATTRLGLIGEPALPYLEKALTSSNPEVRRRAESTKQQIVNAATAWRKELLSKDLTRGLRPAFAFQAQAEMRAGLPVSFLRLKLDDKDAPMTSKLRQLFGPDWSDIRLLPVGNQVIVLLGSDTTLLDATVLNLKNKRAGWAANKLLKPFADHADPARKVEFHMSVRTVLALSQAEDLTQPAAFAGAPPLTSLALTVAAERLQLDMWVPPAEIQAAANWYDKVASKE